MSGNQSFQFTIRFTLAVVLVSAIFSLLIANYGGKVIGPWAVLAAFVLLMFLVGNWLVRGVVSAGKDDPTSPMILETYNDNMQASALVSRLEQVGIQATAVGGFVSGFQAESPGYVDVVVPREDFKKAKDFMDQMDQEDLADE